MFNFSNRTVKTASANKNFAGGTVDEAHGDGHVPATTNTSTTYSTANNCFL